MKTEQSVTGTVVPEWRVDSEEEDLGQMKVSVETLN
jgi:hypothetical protein